jgi:hypothetical protein
VRLRLIASRAGVRVQLLGERREGVLLRLPLSFSAAASAVRVAAIFSAVWPLSRSSWSRYARASANDGGQMSFGWFCVFR